jgi:hypothetical protein
LHTLPDIGQVLQGLDLLIQEIRVKAQEYEIKAELLYDLLYI